jgi:hypothetical protein
MQDLSFIPLPHYLFGASNLILHDNDSTLLNSNGSLSSTQSSTLPLRSLQEIIHNRITQKKREMHTSHNKAYLESLWTEIETLQWVLAEILTLLRRQSSANT